MESDCHTKMLSVLSVACLKSTQLKMKIKTMRVDLPNTLYMRLKATGARVTVLVPGSDKEDKYTRQALGLLLLL